jgi:hypothetical protein
MKIDRVSYRETRSFGTYNNVTIELSANVGPDEISGAVYARLKEEVEGAIAERISSEVFQAEYQHQHQKLSGELYNLTQEVNEAKRRRDVAAAFLKTHGIDKFDDIPF